MNVLLNKGARRIQIEFFECLNFYAAVVVAFLDEQLFRVFRRLERKRVSIENYEETII